MAADLHIHVVTEEVTEEVLAMFFSHTLGSKYFDLSKRVDSLGNAFDIVSETPDVWIGEVSWLKAALFEDGGTYVPDPVERVHDLIGEDLPMLDEELRGKILGAVVVQNETEYRIATVGDVEKFLDGHMGERLFTVSW